MKKKPDWRKASTVAINTPATATEQRACNCSYFPVLPVTSTQLGGRLILTIVGVVRQLEALQRDALS